MTSKNLFFNLMREDYKRRLWAAALTFLVFFFALPVASAMAISEEMRWGDETYLSLMHSVRSIVSLHNGFLATFIVFLSLIIGVTSFSWLHSKQKVDFYHSIPVRREKLFLVNYLDGILIPLAAYAVNLFLALLVAGVYGVLPGDLLLPALSQFGFFMLHYAMMYSVTVLAMMLTGNILIGILGTGVLHFFFPVLIFILEAFYQEFFVTSYRGGSELLAKLIDKCSAFALYVGNYVILLDGTSANMPARIIAAAAVTVAIAAVSLLLYRKRGSEAAGKALAFKVSRPLIRIPIVILSAVSGGLFFWYVRRSIGWTLFGIICGLLLSHCTIEIIYHFDFKKLFSNRISMAVCAVVAILFFCVFRFDLLGYDSYIPNMNSLESMAISMTDWDYWTDYGHTAVDEEGNYTWEFENKNNYILDHTQLSNPETALELVKEAVAQAKGEHSYSERDDESEEGPYVSFSVKFKLKSGRSVFRSYSVSGERAYALAKQNYDSHDYRSTAYPLMIQTAENTAKVKVLKDGWPKEVTRGNAADGTDMVDLLLAAYQEDFINLTSATMEKENPIGTIQFMTKDQAAVENKKEKEASWTSWEYSNILERGYYPIYPSFTKTIGLLEKSGIEINTVLDISQVKAINVDTYQLLGDRGVGVEIPETVTVTGKDEIAELMKNAVYESYSDMNPFQNREDDIVFYVEMRESTRTGSMTYQYSIAKDAMPEFLKKEQEKLLQIIQEPVEDFD